jgi:mono/diheme cytochrome c family protein
VAKDGRPILVMPTNYFQHYSDADLAALIAYLQTLPPVAHAENERSAGPVAKMLVGAGQYVPPAFEIDHDAPHDPAPPAGATAAYGKYLTYLAHCGDCHGPDLKGQTMEGPPQGPDISRTGNPGTWSESEFFTVIRTGATPDGRNLDPTQMPWPRLATLSDTELQAVWEYLKTVQ